jgi:hypothetical protein
LRLLFHCNCPGNDLDQFGGDTGLSSSVVLELEDIHQFHSALGRILHGGHALTLLSSAAFSQKAVHQESVGKLVEVSELIVADAMDHVLVRVVVEPFQAVVEFGETGDGGLVRHGVAVVVPVVDVVVRLLLEHGIGNLEGHGVGHRDELRSSRDGLSHLASKHSAQSTLCSITYKEQRGVRLVDQEPSELSVDGRVDSPAESSICSDRDKQVGLVCGFNGVARVGRVQTLLLQRQLPKVHNGSLPY